MRTAKKQCAALISGLVVVAASFAPALPQSPAGTFTIIVGAPPGGGYDVYGRIVGRHIVEHLPGKPVAVVQNMVGAASKRAAEHIAIVAPKDGSTIGVLYPGAIADSLTIERSKWRYDPTTFVFLGSPDSGIRLCSTRLGSKVKTFNDAKFEVAIMGASAGGGSTHDYPAMLNALAGTKFKIVSGYKATVDIALAFDRGEVDGWCGVELATYTAVRPNWIAKKEVNTIVQFGMKPNEELLAMGIPSIWDFIPPENRKAVELIVAQQTFQRPFVAPPGVPAERAKILQGAFDLTMKSDAFIAEAEKLGVKIEPISGPDVARIVEQMYQTPADVVEQMARAIKP